MPAGPTLRSPRNSEVSPESPGHASALLLRAEQCPVVRRGDADVFLEHPREVLGRVEAVVDADGGDKSVVSVSRSQQRLMRTRWR